VFSATPYAKKPAQILSKTTNGGTNFKQQDFDFQLKIGFCQINEANKELKVKTNNLQQFH